MNLMLFASIREYLEQSYGSMLSKIPTYSTKYLWQSHIYYLFTVWPGDAYGEGLMLTRAPHASLGLISRHLILIFPR